MRGMCAVVVALACDKSPPQETLVDAGNAVREQAASVVVNSDGSTDFFPADVPVY